MTTVPIPKMCCVDGCRKVATHAKKLSDFWVSTCEEHAAGATVSINKAIEAMQPKGSHAK
jgi:hypothetical protein